MLLTTQYLEEADQLADRIAVIDHGRLIAEGTADDLKSRIGGEILTVSVADDSHLPDALRILSAHGDEIPVVDDGQRRVTVPVSDGAALLAGVVRELDDAGATLSEIGLRQPTLDEVFLALTGRPAEHDANSTSNGTVLETSAASRTGGR